MFLPSEVVLQVLQDFPKKDLKAARLVNKQWSSCAAKFLFDTLYISPHKENIDVFQSVTQHPVLRGCVTKLVYDWVGFPTNWTYSQYFKRLFKDFGWRAMLGCTLDSTDHQINAFFESAKGRDIRKAKAECGDFDFIKAGYRRWQDHARYEQRCLKNNKFIRIVKTGLQRLDRLSLVALSDIEWEEPLQVECTGSPLARSWGLHVAQPLDWSIDGPLNNRAFWNILVALSQTERAFKTLR